jgi:hypothetical protein
MSNSNEMGLNFGFNDIDLKDFDLTSVEVVPATMVVGLPENGASTCGNGSYCCSSSTCCCC